MNARIVEMRRLALALALALGATAAGGQAAPPAAAGADTGSFGGTVRDATGAAISGALVRDLISERVAVTGADGRFLISGLPAGARPIDVRAMGFAPAAGSVEVRAGLVAELSVAMQPAPRVTVLDSVRVVGRPADERMREFHERARLGLAARIITEEEIARRRVATTVDLLRLLPGVTVRGEGGTLKLVAGRGMNNFRSLLDGGPPGGGGRRPPRQTSARASDAEAGCVLTYLNGAPVRADEIGLVQPQNLAGVEYYNVSSAPPQYLRGAACTVLLLWTK